jgi:hypothetical protein
MRKSARSVQVYLQGGEYHRGEQRAGNASSAHELGGGNLETIVADVEMCEV